MKKRFQFLSLTSLMLLAIPLAGVAAGNASQEIATATTHSQMAENAADTSTAIMHFHHVINCLVGPKSKYFDAAPGNPCKDMGNGALNDVKRKSAEHAKLLHALNLAERALHATKLAETRQYAAHIAEVLKGVDSNN
jgi:hypothetical protein